MKWRWQMRRRMAVELLFWHFRREGWEQFQFAHFGLIMRSFPQPRPVFCFLGLTEPLP